MPALPPLEMLLAQAARRQQRVEFGRRLVRALWVFGGAYFLLLAVSRFTGWIPNVFSWFTLALVPLGAGMVAWVTHRRVSHREVASLVDHAHDTKDLFLTAMHLDSSAGSYQEHILARAEQSVSTVKALPDIIPWRWQRPTARLLVGATVLAAAMLFLPQLDPFGKHEERQWLATQEERLKELNKTAEMQLAALKPEDAAERQETITQALTKLENAFRLAKPEQREVTRKELRDRQKELGLFWKQLNEETLAKALDQASDRWQKIGQSESSMDPQSKAIRDELREMLRSGDAKQLQERIADMLEKAEALQQKSPDSGESRDGAKDLQRELEEISNALSEVASSDPLRETLQRAIEQMRLAQNPSMQKDAAGGAQQSMEQLQQQIESLSEQLKQLQEMESALDAAQLAQQLNEMGQMPGSGDMPGAGSGMKGYADLYKKLLAEAGGGGSGNGPGMKGPGTGEGGVAPEDDSLDTGFKKEQAPSHLVAGKTLLQWQTKAASEAGTASKDYQDSVQELKQGLSEAIRQEKVPAGYHDQIQRYFDTLKEEPPSDVDGLD